MIGWNIIRPILSPQSSLIKMILIKMNFIVNNHLFCCWKVRYPDTASKIESCTIVFCKGEKKWDSSRDRFERRSTSSCLHAGDLDREILSPLKDLSTSSSLRMIK